MVQLRGIRRRTAAVSTVVAATVVAAVVGIAPGTPSQALVPFYRAGSNTFPAGSAGIFVTFSVPMVNTNYAVSVQPRDTAGYSPTSVCTYFNVLHKTVNGFDVQHKRCDDGVPVPLDFVLGLDWVAMPFA